MPVWLKIKEILENEIHPNHLLGIVELVLYFLFLIKNLITFILSSSQDDTSLVRKKEKSTQKSSVQPSLPTRSSSRINQNSKPKYTFNNENESDEEN
jgi:hypothetical protein